MIQKEKQPTVQTKWRGIINERPSDMSFEDYKMYRKVQKNVIKLMMGPKLVWDSKKQGTFYGNINEAIKKAEQEKLLNNLKTEDEQN